MKKRGSLTVLRTEQNSFILAEAKLCLHDKKTNLIGLFIVYASGKYI